MKNKGKRLQKDNHQLKLCVDCRSTVLRCILIQDGNGVLDVQQFSL